MKIYKLLASSLILIAGLTSCDQSDDDGTDYEEVVVAEESPDTYSDRATVMNPVDETSTEVTPDATTGDRTTPEQTGPNTEEQKLDYSAYQKLLEDKQQIEENIKSLQESVRQLKKKNGGSNGNLGWLVSFALGAIGGVVASLLLRKNQQQVVQSVQNDSDSFNQQEKEIKRLKQDVQRLEEEMTRLVDEQRRRQTEAENAKYKATQTISSKQSTTTSGAKQSAKSVGSKQSSTIVDSKQSEIPPVVPPAPPVVPPKDKIRGAYGNIMILDANTLVIEDGSFKGTNSGEPFVFQLNEDKGTGTFSFTHAIEEQLLHNLATYEKYLEPFNHFSGARKAMVVAPGTVVHRDGYWQVEKKITINIS